MLKRVVFFVICSVLVGLMNVLNVFAADLNEEKLRKNFWIGIRKTLSERGVPIQGLDISKINITKKKKVTLDNGWELYVVKMEINAFLPNGNTEVITFVTDKDGRYQFYSVFDILKQINLTEDIVFDFERVEVPKDFGVSMFYGNGKAEVIFVGDPFCPYCRKAFNYLSKNLGKIKVIKYVHYPLSFHYGAEFASQVMEYALKEKKGIALEVFNYLYNLDPSQLGNNKSEADKKLAQLLLQRFPRLAKSEDELIKVAQKYSGFVKKDMEIAYTKFKVKGTPFLIIDGLTVSGFNVERIEKFLNMSNRDK